MAGKPAVRPAPARARFAVGELVAHRLFAYRGVVFDVDATFQGSDAWYRSVARTRPPRNAPWYHVLVDGATHTTYVAERNLAPDAAATPVRHPLVDHFFGDFRDGRHVARNPAN
jgi:heat shock protein HspQ